MNNKALNEKIEQWLDGLMPPEEAAAFEAEMLADEALQNEVEVHRRVRQEIEHALYKDYRRKAAVWMTELDQLPPPPTETPPVPWWKKYRGAMIWFAAAFVVVVLIYKWLDKKPEEVIQATQTTLPQSPSDPSNETAQPAGDTTKYPPQRSEQNTANSRKTPPTEAQKVSDPKTETRNSSDSASVPTHTAWADTAENKNNDKLLPDRTEPKPVTPTKTFDRTVVAMPPVRYASNDFSETAGKVDFKLRTQMLSSNRVTLLSEPLKNVDIERGLIGLKEHNQDEILRQHNVEYIVLSTLKGRAIDLIRSPTTGASSYFCKLTVELRILDAKTAAPKATYVLQNPGYKNIDANRWQTFISPQAAENAAVEAIGKELQEVLKTFFPLHGWVIEVREQDNREAKTLLVDIGNKQSVQKGDVFNVVYERRLAAGTGGIDAISEIGEVVIKEVYGVTAIATVRRGGMEILRLMKEDATLFVRSKN